MPLVGARGIFKPRLCELPLSVLTACDGPYDDRTSHDGRFLYAYRGRDPRHRDNEALRDGQARGDLVPARGAGHAQPEHRHRGRGPGRAGGRARSLRRRLRGARLRDDGPPRGHDDLGDPGLPAPARHHRRGRRPADAALPRARGAPRHRARARREPRRAQGAPRRDPAHHRRLVGQADGDPGRGGRAGRRRSGVPAPGERGRAPRDAGDGGGGRWRRRRDGRLPGREAPARLQARQGHLPPRPRRDSSPRDRAPPCDPRRTSSSSTTPSRLQ